MSAFPWLGEIPVVFNPYLREREAFLVAEPFPLPKLQAPRFSVNDSGNVEVTFRYQPLALPDPRKAIALDNIMATTEAEDRRWRRRERKMVSLKRKTKAQRCLDYASNVRRRKRWAEMRRRKRTR